MHNKKEKEKEKEIEIEIEIEQESTSLVHQIHNSRDNDLDNMSIAHTGASSTIPVEWSPENEMIMVEWCDIAQCYKWLNARAHGRFSYMHAWFTIPAITLSTISGTASFAQASLPISYQVYAPMVIGTINILIGILTTIQQYLKISELNEAHRVSSIAWDKFARNIRIELAKKPEERMDAGSFLKLSRQEFDRLMETSPMVQENVIKEFNVKFSGKEGTPERKRYDELKKPDICNTIISANETRHQWYLEIDKPVPIFIQRPIFDNSKDELIREQQRHISEKEDYIKRYAELEKNAERKKMELLALSEKQIQQMEHHYTTQCVKIEEYIKKFEKIYDRKPLTEEIYNNMQDDIDLECLSKFLLTYSTIETV